VSARVAGRNVNAHIPPVRSPRVGCAEQLLEHGTSDSLAAKVR
jgi:hypothetical protein